MAKNKRKQAAAQPKPDQAKSVAAAGTGFGAMRWDMKIVWVCMHGLLFFVPFAMGNLTFLGIGNGLPISFDQFDIVKLVVMRAATIIAIAAWGAGMLLHGGKLRRTKIDWLVLAFVVWVLISSLFSIHIPTAIFGKYRRFEGWISFVNYATVFFLIVQMADRASRIRSFARTFVLSSMVVTWYGLMQYFSADFVQWGNLPFEATRSFSTYGNPDLLGGFLVIAFPVAVALAISESSRIWRVIYWIATFMLSAVLITAFTRGAWIGAFAAACVMVFAVVRARVKTEPIDWGFGAAAVLAVVAIIVKSLSSSNLVLNFGARVVSIFQFTEGSAKSRFQIWQAAIDAIKARPIFGFGADTFRLVFPMYKPEAYSQYNGYLSVADNVHNYPLQLMSGIGIPGFLLLYGTIAFALYLGAPVAFGRKTGASRMMQAGAWTAVFGYMVHLMFGLSVTGSTVFLWVMLGLALAPTAKSVEVPGMQANWMAVRTGAAVALAAACVFASVFNIQYIVADRYYLMGRIAVVGIDNKIAYLNKAIKLNPYNDMYRAEVGLQYQSELSVFLGQIQQQEAQGQDVTAAKAEARRIADLGEKANLETIKFVPSEYDNYVFLASLYNMVAESLDQSYSQKAIDIAREGVEVEYYGPAIRYQLARALADSGKSAEAIPELELAVRFDPAYLEAKKFLASVLAANGQTGRAVEMYKAILAVSPDDWYAKSELERLEGSSTVATGTKAP